MKNELASGRWGWAQFESFALTCLRKGERTMNGKESSRVVSACAIVAMLWIAGSVGEAATYTVTALGTLGGSWDVPFGINNSGQVVGQAATAGNAGEAAFLWSSSTGMIDLGPTLAATLGGPATNSSSQAINDSGQVVGVTWNANGTAEDAFLISGSTVTYLGNLGGSMSGAYAINKSGLIAGYTEAPGMSQEAFLYSGGTMAGLGTLGGGTSFAQGINNSGQVVGIASYHAFLWSSSTGMTDLGTLFGQSGSDAEAINSSGQVAGSCFTVGGNGSDDHAFLWSSSTGMTYLGTLGGAYSTAYAINDMGMVVGDSETAAGQEHAFLYSGGTMYDLNTLISPLSGWTLTYADGINDQGQIIGFGLYDGSTRSFLLTPNAVPEPISMIFFGTGLVAVGGYVARRKMLRTA